MLSHSWEGGGTTQGAQLSAGVSWLWQHCATRGAGWAPATNQRLLPGYWSTDPGARGAPAAMRRSWARVQQRQRWVRFASAHPGPCTWLGATATTQLRLELDTGQVMSALRTMTEDLRVPRDPNAWRLRARQPAMRHAMVFLAFAVLLAIPGEGKKAKSRSKKHGSAPSTQCEQQAKAAAAAAAGGEAQAHLKAAIALAECRPHSLSRGSGCSVLVRREPPRFAHLEPWPLPQVFQGAGRR